MANDIASGQTSTHANLLEVGGPRYDDAEPEDVLSWERESGDWAKVVDWSLAHRHGTRVRNLSRRPIEVELDPESLDWVAKAHAGTPPYSCVEADDLIFLSVVRRRGSRIHDSVAAGAYGSACWRVINMSADRTSLFRITARLWRASCGWDERDPRVQGGLLELEGVVPCRAVNATVYPAVDLCAPLSARGMGLNAVISNCTSGARSRTAAPSLYSPFTVL